MELINSAALALVYTPGWNHDDAWGGYWWIGRLVFLAFWVAAAVALVWWVRRSTARREPTGIERAQAILTERYARDELTADEYRERLDNLR